MPRHAPIELPAGQRAALWPLYARHTLMPVMIEAVLDGSMGRAFAAQDLQAPAAFLELGAFALFAGDPASPAVPALVRAAQGLQLVCDTPAWFERVAVLLPPDYHPHTRQQFSPAPLSPSHLESLRQPQCKDVEIRFVDDALWSAYTASGLHGQFEENFGSAETFRAQGFVVAALLQGEVVGHAGTYSVSRTGMEVQIEVLAPYRGMGIATALAAELLLHSLQRGLEPHWDAENRISSRLALRLGYHLERTYDVYFPDGL